MGRRKKGRDISGFVLIDKAAGIGSTEIVTQIRRFFDAKKAGHGGTLDPDATGLLPIALGEATKILPLLEDKTKKYSFTVNWGQETTSDDAAGEIVQQSDYRPSLSEIINILPQFSGQIMQSPPRVSAIKINGKRAYDLERSGEAFEIKPRPLFMHNLSLKEHRGDETDFEMECGKGGYVRAIARDMGRALGGYAHVKTLRRTNALGFDIEQATTLDMITEDNLIELESLTLFEQVMINQDQFEYIRNGRAIQLDADADILLALFDNNAVAILKYVDQEYKVFRGLNPPPQNQ